MSPHQGESVDDGIVCLYKETDQVVIAILCRQVERSQSQFRLGVHEGFMPQQHVGNLFMPILCRQVEGCFSVIL